MDEPQEETGPLGSFDAEVKEMLGLFDVPAFARRGQELESALVRIHQRLQSRRIEMLEIVRLRLRQWASATKGPEDALRYFAEPIEPLWPLSGSKPPRWGSRTAGFWTLRPLARDLIGSVDRFNRRWAEQIEKVDLTLINQMVVNYNRYYLLEKEISLGSARLASRHFVPKTPVSLDDLRASFPPLPVPSLRK